MLSIGNRLFAAVPEDTTPPAFNIINAGGPAPAASGLAVESPLLRSGLLRLSWPLRCGRMRQLGRWSCCRCRLRLPPLRLHCHLYAGTRKVRQGAAAEAATTLRTQQNPENPTLSQAAHQVLAGLQIQGPKRTVVRQLHALGACSARR